MKLARLVFLHSICAALLLPVASAQAQTVKKVSDGQVSKTAPNWAHFIASDKGFFRREGVEPEVFYVGNVANTVQQLVAGSFDVASSTFDTAIRAVANGGNVVLVGGMVTKYPYSIMASKDVTSAADMKGKRIILPFAKDLLTTVWNRWLTEQGMKPEDVEQLYTGATQRTGGAADTAVRFPGRRGRATASSSTSAPTARITGF
jgi:ABC-type nitrate/sulfonate/bicarbonate transport system substrate-binding protein